MSRAQIDRELLRFEQELRTAHAHVLTIKRVDCSDGRISTVTVEPTAPASTRFVWAQMVDEVLIEVGRFGRWELDHTEDGLELLKAIARAVIAGDVVEQAAGRGGATTIRLKDGSTVRSERR